MKKIISILCLMTIFLQYAFVVEANSSETATEQTETVFQLGLMAQNQDGEDDLSETVTRADFTEMVYKMLYNGVEVSGATKSYYSDVDIYHYAAPYIQMLSENGVIHGYDDGNFYPGKTITINEAVTIILRAIGYDVRFNMGESTKSIASDLDIGNGLNFSAELTRKDAAGIIYDTLYADTLKSDFQGEGIAKAGLVMYEFLGLEYMDGVVDGIDGKSLYDRYVREGVISIDEKQYNISCEIDENLLGKYVRFYYSEEDEAIKAVVPRKNNVLVINAASIIDGNNTEITYYNQNDKRKTVKISIKADILYNGYVVNSISENIPQNGDITLIDRKDDGEYDAVFITEYTSYLVSRASEHEEVITPYNGESIELKNYEEKEIVDKNKANLEITAITTDSVISVYQSGTKYIKILKSDEAVTGSITSIDIDDLGRTVITLGERQVILCDNCYFGGISLLIGANVTVYLDAFGMGAAVKAEKTADWEFGYIIFAKEDDGSLMEDSIRLKILTMSGEQETLYIVDKTRIDGVRVKIDNAMAYLNGAFNNFDDEIAGGEEHKKELVTTRLIRFKRNENIISYMDTPLRYGLYDESAKPVMTQNDALLLRVKGNLYRPENKRDFKAVYPEYVDLQGELFYSENTPIFIVPTEENTNPDKDDYTVTSGSEFYSSDGEFMYMSGYYTDVNSFTPDVIVVRKGTSKSGSTRLLVVNKIKEVWDEREGEIVPQIEGYINGSLMSMKVDIKNSTVPADTIKKGDCIAYDMISEKLRLTELIYRKGGGGALNNNYYWSKNNAGSLFNVGFRSIIGKAGHISDNYMHLKIDDESKMDEVVPLSNNIAFYYSSEPRNSVHTGDSSGIRENDIVIVSSRQGIQQDIIVIK